MPLFESFPKMARLKRGCVITEKIDGTNAQVCIVELPDGDVMPTDTPIVAAVGKRLLYAGSRNRWITPQDDNFGFAKWVLENAEQLASLGPGRHYGEWWGRGIQRTYGLTDRRFSLFNAHRWSGKVPEATAPACCGVVPVVYGGEFSTAAIDGVMDKLRADGSAAAPGFMQPEGIIVFHTASRTSFKLTLENDESPKTAIAA